MHPPNHKVIGSIINSPSSSRFLNDPTHSSYSLKLPLRPYHQPQPLPTISFHASLSTQSNPSYNHHGLTYHAGIPHEKRTLKPSAAYGTLDKNLPMYTYKITPSLSNLNEPTSFTPLSNSNLNTSFSKTKTVSPRLSFYDVLGSTTS